MSCGGAGSGGGSPPTRCWPGCWPGCWPRAGPAAGPVLARLLAQLPRGSAAARRPAALLGPMPLMESVMPKGERLLGTVATPWTRQAPPDPPKFPHVEPCPNDRLYCKKCGYHSGAVADWNASQESCSNCGASLAVIDSRQELNFMMYRMHITDFWVGLRRKGNKFFWVKGGSSDTNLFHVNIANDGDCGHIDSAFISTRRCSSLRNWLCTIGHFDPKTSF